MMKPTIYTIATQAGVSIATVSRALNNGPRVSEATRARILQIAQDLGYQPSASARNLAMNTTETLALVLPQISGPYFSEFIRGAEGVARNHQYHLLIYSSFDLDGDDPLLRLLPTRTDGAILGTSSSTCDYINDLHRRNFPFLLLEHHAPGLAVNAINPDNETGAQKLTNHLIQQHGFQRIGFICGPAYRAHSGERLRGYQRALQNANIPFRTELTAQGDFDEASGYTATHQLLSLPEPPQAIFASNDQMAIGALAAANQRGLSVPDDLAVVGFDDIPAAQYLHPPLTTVNLSIYDQGETAIKLLMQVIAEPDQPPQIITIATSLVIRRSCGCNA
jgi:DNA-binding LacI/PurR family transcriptional regulator